MKFYEYFDFLPYIDGRQEFGLLAILICLGVLYAIFPSANE